MNILVPNYALGRTYKFEEETNSVSKIFLMPYFNNTGFQKILIFDKEIHFTKKDILAFTNKSMIFTRQIFNEYLNV